MPPGASLSEDDIFFILSSRRRRFVLRYLRPVEEPVDRRDLVDALAAWENGVDPEDLTEAQRRTVNVSLYQTHLDELSDAGVVEYDTDTGRVELTDRIGEFAGYLDRWQEIAVDVDDGPGDGGRKVAECVDGSVAVGPTRGDQASGAPATEDEADTRTHQLLPFIGLAAASLGLYVAVIVDSGVIWRAPLFVAALIVLGLVVVHAYPLYRFRRWNWFRPK